MALLRACAVRVFLAGMAYDPTDPRKRRIRAQLFEHLLAVEPKPTTCRCENCTTGRGDRPTRKERKLMAELHDTSPALYPDCSPSHTHESDDILKRMSQRMIRAKMAADFAARAAEKRRQGR